MQHWIVKRKVLGSRTLGPILSNNALRNIPSSSSELVGLTRSVRRKSVPTPWYPSLCHRTGWQSFLLTLFTVYSSCSQQYRQELAGMTKRWGELPSNIWCFVHRHLHHKVLTYIEYRAVSGVFRRPTPSPTSRPPSATKAEGTHSPGGEGGGVNISEAARQWIGLL
jgi:hypothetical protein